MGLPCGWLGTSDLSYHLLPGKHVSRKLDQELSQDLNPGIQLGCGFNHWSDVCLGSLLSLSCLGIYLYRAVLGSLLLDSLRISFLESSVFLS